MQRRVADPTVRTGISKHTADGIKIGFIDVETTGVGQTDMVRSISLQDTLLGTDVSGRRTLARVRR